MKFFDGVIHPKQCHLLTESVTQLSLNKLRYNTSKAPGFFCLPHAKIFKLTCTVADEVVCVHRCTMPSCRQRARRSLRSARFTQTP